MKTGTSLTDAEIIKAFDCCYTDRYPDCTECPRYNREKEGCMDVGNGNIFDLPKAVTDLINRYQATINRLKAENKNCGVKIQNQREQLKACNEKIKEQQAEIEGLTTENERLNRKVEELSLVLSDTIKIRYKEAKSEACKEFAERVNIIIGDVYDKHIFGNNDLEAEEKDAVINFSDDVTYQINNLLKETGCGE